VTYAAGASSASDSPPVVPDREQPVAADALPEPAVLVGNNREECEVSTASEGQLTSDVPLIKEQAANNGLDAERDNLLR